MRKKLEVICLGFLRVLSKPQRKHLLVYLTGIFFLVKFRSIREISSLYGQGSTDALQNFLNGTPGKIQRLESENHRWVSSSAGGQTPLIILDDTPCPREGKKIEGLGIHHSASGLIQGLCAVTAIIKIKSMRLVWAIRGYRPKKSCGVHPFKSKVTLALEILREIQRVFFQKLIVLMDSWYACAPILGQIIQGNGIFVAAIKKNRIVEVSGRKTVVRALAKGPRSYKTVRLSKKRKFKVARKIVFLPKVGTILLLICKQGNEARFLITNGLTMTESEAVWLYAQRFDIEIFHKEIKQHLGFGELFMRSWQGVQTHWTLIAIAYNLITLWNGSRKRSFRQMIRHFRSAVNEESLRNLPRKLKIAT